MNEPNTFLFDKNGIIRSGWRVVVFLFTFFVTAVTLGAAAQYAFTALGVNAAANPAWLLVTNGILSLVPALVIGWLCGKLFENLPYKALGAAFTSGWFKNLLLGSLVGAVTLSFAVLIAFAFGGERFEINLADGANAVIASLSASFLVFAVASAFEEALFRGYILQTMDRSGLAWLAILLTSVFFGAVHAGNPNAGVISTLNTILAGIWFSVAYLKTRDLWFVWGMHWMWNFTQGSVFGIEVSGLTDITTNPLLKEIDHGPTWLTGQTYGIEGGIACTVALIISINAIHFWPNKKEN